jgi:hypothetical protein
MFASAHSSPEQWMNFFLMVGAGSATLAGLVFVAMTINLRDTIRDATHRFRAINMLTGFTAAFLVSALALMGNQTFRAIGVEWLVVSLLATAINTNGYIQAFRLRSSLYALSAFRIVGGSACYAGQLVGATLLIFGSVAGVYVCAISLVVSFVFFVSGSWLLVVGPAPSADDTSV